MAVRDGRWVPTFPKAKYISHKGEYAAWEESTKRGETRAGGGGNVFRYNCQPNLKPKSPPYRRATHKKLGDKGKMAVLAFSQAPLRCAAPCQSRSRFKIPTPFASCFRTLRSVALSRGSP